MRLIVFATILLIGPAMAGCLDGGIGICLGPEEPKKILRDNACTQWIIEIDHVSGQAPDPEALELLKTRMNSLVHKDSITITISDRNLQGQDTWTEAELRNLESETRDHQTGGSTITTHVLYVDGELAGKPTVVGFAAGSRYVVIFKENIRDATSDILVRTTASQFEQSVLVHEFGHIIGLVNNGIPMQTDHEDDDHPGHSDNQNSVMWWQIERTSALDLFGDGATPTRFDANDRADVCAAGGKC